MFEELCFPGRPGISSSIVSSPALPLPCRNRSFLSDPTVKTPRFRPLSPDAWTYDELIRPGKTFDARGRKVMEQAQTMAIQISMQLQTAPSTPSQVGSVEVSAFFKAGIRINEMMITKVPMANNAITASFCRNGILSLKIYGMGRIKIINSPTR
jgi:hypothetical protein